MIAELDDERHERLWRICDALISSSGARAAMICDEATFAVLVSVGDASGGGNVAGVQSIAPGKRVVRGDAGQIYGVDIPGGALLAVLHDAEVLGRVREAAEKAVEEAAAVLAELADQGPSIQR